MFYRVIRDETVLDTQHPTLQTDDSTVGRL